ARKNIFRAPRHPGDRVPPGSAFASAGVPAAIAPLRPPGAKPTSTVRHTSARCHSQRLQHGFQTIEPFRLLLLLTFPTLPAISPASSVSSPLPRSNDVCSRTAKSPSQHEPAPTWAFI